jgi:hypothetical protein
VFELSAVYFRKFAGPPRGMNNPAADVDIRDQARGWVVCTQLLVLVTAHRGRSGLDDGTYMRPHEQSALS